MDKNVLSATKDGVFYEVGQIIFNSIFITSIKYHEPLGDGDRHYVDIYYSDDTIVRYFNIDSVYWKSTEDA